MILTTLQSTTGTVIVGGATVSTISVGGNPIVKNGDDFIIDTKAARRDLTSSLVLTGATIAANTLSGLSAKAAEVNDTKAYIESLSDEELARLCDLGDQELTSSPKKLTKYLLLGGGVLFAIWNFSSDEFQVSILEFANKYFKPLLDELINFDSSQTINWGGSGERLALWGWVWEFVKGNALFGIGFESQFSHVFFANGFWKTKVSVEVQWLYILLQKGFFGLLGFVAYEWYCLRETFRAFRNDLHERPNIPIVFFVMAAGYFLNLFTCAAFEDLEFFYVLFAIVEGYTELSLGMEKDEPKEKHYQIRISPIFLNSDQKE